jgi:hypothetical protein
MRTIGGDPPGAALEDQLIQAYTDHPDAVERSLDKIAMAYKAGKIHSPWGAAKTEVAKATEAARNPTHNQGTTKTKALQRAEQWMRTAGLHYDRESELLDELYGDRGRLRDHPATRDRMLELWHELRPLGQQLDQEAVEAGIRYQQHRATLKDTAKPAETAEQRLERQRKLAAKKAFGNIDISEALT